MPVNPSIISSFVVLISEVIKNIVYTIFAFDSKSALQRSAIFLIFFLVIHCSGNLIIFKNDQGDQFNAYGYFLRNSPIILIIETYLLIAGVIHMFAATYIVLRDGKYKAIFECGKSSTSSIWTRLRLSITGTIVLAFIIIHLYDFRFGNEYKAPPLKSLQKNPWYPYFGGEENVSYVRDLYKLQVEVFSNKYKCIFYIASMYFLSSHLKLGWARVNIRIIPKDHRQNTKLLVNYSLDFLCLLFASTVMATYMSQTTKYKIV
jgi:succinate dehydrogenase / fumarate reductase cytochrome b subunit